MKKVVKAWRNGKTVFLENDRNVVALSPHSGDIYWSIAEEADGLGGYKLVYNYISRSDGILFQASCLVGEGSSYGSGKSGSCTFEGEFTT